MMLNAIDSDCDSDCEVPCRAVLLSLPSLFILLLFRLRPYVRSVPSVTELELMTQLLFFFSFLGWLIDWSLVVMEGNEKRKRKKEKTFLSGSGYT